MAAGAPHPWRADAAPRGQFARLSAHQVDDLVAQYRTGVPMAELSLRFSVHRSTVLDHVKRRGLPLRAHQPKLADVAEVRRLYEQGIDMTAIGRQFGVHRETVKRALGLRP